MRLHDRIGGGGGGNDGGKNKTKMAPPIGF